MINEENEMPKISVITPLYNAEKYIEKTIDCILNQTYKDFEWIMIDDCGNDKKSRRQAGI